MAGLEQAQHAEFISFEKYKARKGKMPAWENILFLNCPACCFALGNGTAGKPGLMYELHSPLLTRNAPGAEQLPVHFINESMHPVTQPVVHPYQTRTSNHGSTSATRRIFHRSIQ